MTILAFFALAAWIYLAVSHGGFWRANQRLEAAPAPEVWPAVTAIVPARNEAASVGAVVAAHMAADYQGDFCVVLVDDGSDDGTADKARAAAEGSDRLTIIDGAPLPDGWTGKLWAVQQGIEEARGAQPTYYLLTDADIVFAPDTLARLVAKAEAEDLSLASLMARLDARGLWGGLLIPAFVFFFQKLYPFPLSNDANENVAAAAGGCMLVRADDFDAAGGVAAIGDRLIDDCALARNIKDLTPATRTWIGLADTEATSLRDNRSLSSIWNMVARTAYAQLGFSPLVLAGAVFGMGLIYLIPPLVALSLAIHQNLLATFFALFAWGIMARIFWPTVKLYRGEPWQSATLPVAAALYTIMTVHSGLRQVQGRGGQWKGRHYDLSRNA